MAVGYRASSTTGNLVLTTSVAPAVPAGAASGDIALVGLSMWEASDPTITAPTGFTMFISVVSGNIKLKVFWKRLTAADSGSYTFSWTGSQWTSGHAVLITGGLASGDPVTIRDTAIATSSTVVTTSVTTTFEPFLAHLTATDNSTSGTPPTGYTEVQDADGGSLNYRIPGATGSHTASGGTLAVSTLHHAALIAVEPESAGAAVRPSPRRRGPNYRR